MYRSMVAIMGAALLAGGAGAEESFRWSPDAIRAHMSFLASDNLRGRETGTRDYDIAADYVAAQFATLG